MVVIILGGGRHVFVVTVNFSHYSHLIIPQVYLVGVGTKANRVK